MVYHRHGITSDGVYRIYHTGHPFLDFSGVFCLLLLARVVKRCTIGLYNHKHFGPFLTNWVEKRIFPQRMKYAMVLVMSSSLAFPVVHHVQSHCCSMVRWLHGLLLLSGHGDIQAPKKNITKGYKHITKRSKNVPL